MLFLCHFIRFNQSEWEKAKKFVINWSKVIFPPFRIVFIYAFFFLAVRVTTDNSDLNCQDNDNRCAHYIWISIDKSCEFASFFSSGVDVLTTCFRYQSDRTPVTFPLLQLVLIFFFVWFCFDFDLIAYSESFIHWFTLQIKTAYRILRN